ncbi:MAG: hypothetical protein ACK5TR_05790 [Alphaproteobacteria bacterium]|jgi:hypothetical protein|nr:hypothetical protein [Alphaproteobacteria bacterium]
MKKYFAKGLTLGFLVSGMLACPQVHASCPVITDTDRVVVDGYINRGHHRHPLWFHDRPWRIVEDEFLVKDVFSTPPFGGRRIGDPIFRPLNDIFYCAYPVKTDDYPYVRWFTIFPEEDFVAYEGARPHYHDWLVSDVRRIIGWDWERRRHHWEEERLRWHHRRELRREERILGRELRHDERILGHELGRRAHMVNRELHREERAAQHELHREFERDRAEVRREFRERNR